jgi:hypothetical protein
MGQTVLEHRAFHLRPFSPTLGLSLSIQTSLELPLPSAFSLYPELLVVALVQA